MCRIYIINLNFMVFLILLLDMKINSILGLKMKSPASEFKQHTVVRPRVLHSRTKREIRTTKHTEGLHHPEVTMSMNIIDEEYIMDLKLNEDLIPQGHVVSYHENGETVTHKPEKEELDICQYSGVVRDKPNSWAAVSTCRGVRGVIYDGQRMRHIEPAESDEINSKHYVYDHADQTARYQCGVTPYAYNSTRHESLMNQHQLPMMSSAARYQAQNPQIHGPYNSNSASRYVELVLVVDHGTYVSHGKNRASVHREMKDLANIVNSMYTPLNIFTALVGVEIWTDGDKIAIGQSGPTLNSFMEYRKKQLLKTIHNDNAQLITSKKFEGTVLGLGFVGGICSDDFSGSVVSKSSSVIGLAASVAAHEMGHNLGMKHDDDVPNCRCPEVNCIMNRYASEEPGHWSSCSLESLKETLVKNLDHCLRNKPQSLFDSPTCGNGFVEPGEQCNCGLVADKRKRNACHSCCHPQTCMLRRNATCAAGECCDLSTCRLLSAGTVCRGAHKECDLPEHCTGHSEFCPADVFKMDSTPCGKHREAYCFAGSCKSHLDQCRELWGTSARNGNDICYTYQYKKSYCYGRKAYTCQPEHEFCGRLQCQNTGPFQYKEFEHRFETFDLRSGGKYHKCQRVSMNMNSVDVGLVPDGAKCGDNKMCVKQRCVSVDVIRGDFRKRAGAVCPSDGSVDCNGQGTCDSEGRCQCKPGFGSPNCSKNLKDHGDFYQTGGFGAPKGFNKTGNFGAPKGFNNTGGFGTPKAFNKTGGFGTPKGFNKTRGFGTPKGYKTGSFDIPENSYKTGGFDAPEGFNNTGTDTNRNDQNSNYLIAIYIIFLGILPLVLLILTICFCRRSRNISTKQNHTSFFNKFPNININTFSSILPSGLYKSNGTVDNFQVNRSHTISNEIHSTQTNPTKITKQDIVVVTDNIHRGTSSSANTGNNNESHLSKTVLNTHKILKPKPPTHPKPILVQNGRNGNKHNTELGLNKNVTKGIPVIPSPKPIIVLPNENKPRMVIANDLESILAARKIKVEES